MNALILGSGAREHALAHKLSESPLISKLFVAPGNGGTEREFENLSITLSDFETLALTIRERNLELVVVGPEQPLVDGFVDFLQQHADLFFRTLHVIGPDQACAALEGSKDFSKQVMQEAGIPTAGARVFTVADWEELEQYIQQHALPVVIKADGLAAGKGVAVCTSHQEAIDFSASVLKDSVFGDQNSSVLVEEFLDGIEVSMFALCDGIHYQLLPEAKDYKRIFDGDKGPNTGGMGSVSPVPFVDDVFRQKVEDRVLKPLFQTLQKRGLHYKGFLFVGLMKVGDEPFVIEFNARLGDPETQTILNRIEGDLVPAFLSVRDQTLDQHPILVKDMAVATVVLCAEHYPDTPAKGDAMEISESAANGKIYIAGAVQKDGILVTSGGRVASCTGMGARPDEALSQAYSLVEAVRFRGMQYRKDVGKDVWEN